MLEMLKSKLLNRQREGNLRELPKNFGHALPLIDFASNDYLGLTRSPQYIENLFKEWEKIRCNPSLPFSGSTGSRLLTGNSCYAEELEAQIAHYHHAETSLLFNCGYMANLGLISALRNENAVIFYDTAVHASVYDAIRLSQLESYPFKHNDLKHLKKRLENRQTAIPIVCIESIYSMDGSIAPLNEISQLCLQHQALLIVDEAHAIGVFGPEGRGLVVQEKLEAVTCARVITFGKALGSHGAAVLCDRTLREYLINFSRPYIYTTALPPYHLAAIQCVYHLLPCLEEERQRLKHLITLFRKNTLTSSQTTIHPIYIMGNQEVKKCMYAFLQSGFDVRAILSPTVSKGSECLRICLHAFNTEEQVICLTRQINHYLGKEKGKHG